MHSIHYKYIDTRTKAPVCMMAASVPPTGESLCMTGQTDGRQTDRQQTEPLCFLLGAASVTKKRKSDTLVSSHHRNTKGE